MWSLVFHQAMRRRARTGAVILAILVASVSFALLTSAVATSRLAVEGTVDQNFRGAYDILVRPVGSANSIERSQNLVQQNYLANVYGGITTDQLRTIQKIQGVEVAAPIAMIGYILPAVPIRVPVDRFLGKGQDQVFGIRQQWATDRGLTRIPDKAGYLYFTRRHRTFDGAIGGSLRDPESARPVAPCQSFEHSQKPPRSAFDLARLSYLACSGSNPVPRGRQFDQFPHGRTGFVIYYQIPMLVAAIDPARESKLVGLDGAVVRGRYLEESDRTQVVRPDGRHGPALRQVPVLMAQRPLTDDRLEVRLDKLALGPAARVPGHLASAHAEDWLASRRRTSLDTVELDDRRVYRLILRLYRREVPNANVDYWSPGPARVHSGGASTIDVKARPPLPAETFRSSYLGGYLAPQVSADRSFRGLLPHESSTVLNGGVPVFPVLHQVGVFDAKLLEGFSALSEVPLTNYYPPDAAPGDERSAELLRGRALLPNANLAGYLQQPPMVLTTLRALPIFLDPRVFPDVDPDIAAAPVSVIRVRVAGVSGADELSRERVRLVAERIARETGLQVDITVGSSPTPLRVSLPEGSYGRPRLTLEEGWVQKGVGVRLLAAVDGKSLILFGLVLAVCVLFLANATTAAVRSRRSELGVLSCLGWAPVSMFALIEVELVVTGAVAGAAGTITAAGLVPLAGLHTEWWQVLLITPTATLIAALAGVWPAWRASRSSPISATAPPVTKPRRVRRVHTIVGLATAGVIRMPGRTVMGASGLMIGVAAMSALVSVQLAFRGSVVGTALGDAVAVQVRGVDYLAAVLVVGLGAFAVADIAYLNIAERTSEIGTLRALGWSDRHVRTLFAAEALLTAALGAVVGALLGVVATTLFLGTPVTQSLSLAALVAGAGLLAALFAVAVPVLRLDRIEPASAVVTGE